MTELSGDEILTAEERFLITHKGGRQRALALLALGQSGPKLGIVGEQLALRAEAIRGMDKEVARKFRKGLSKAAEALSTVLNEDAALPTPADEGVVPDGSSLEHVGADFELALREGPATAAEIGEVTELPADPESLSGDSNASEEVASGDTAGDGLETLPDEQVDEAENKGEVAVKASSVMRFFLAEVMGREMTAYTRGDIELATTLIKNGNFLPATRKQPDGSKIDAEARLARFFATNGDIQAIAKAEDSNTPAVSQWFKKIREKAVAERKRIQQNTTGVTNTSLPELQERSLDEEPTHVRLAVRWGEYLELPSEQRAALREMLNPVATVRDISENKMLVCGRFRSVLVDEQGYIVEFPTIERRKLVAVWKLFGVGKNTTNNRAILRTPDSLSHRVASMNAQYNVTRAEGITQETHEGMQELLALLSEGDLAPEASAVEQGSGARRALVVSFEDEGGAPSIVRQ